MAGVSVGDDFVSEINVTPFVDVMLVLLIIFMVTAPMMTEGLEVDLPKVEASTTLPTENDHLILTVQADGSLFFDEHATTVDDLPTLLQQLAAGRQIFLQADENVRYGVVMEIMGKIRSAGFDNIGMVTVSAPSTADETPKLPFRNGT